MESEKALELFKKMGLGMFDAQVYLALLSLGPLTAARLAEELGATRHQVYTSLKRLFTRGLVEVSKGKPALYRAVSPEIVVDAFRAEMSKLSEEALRYMSSIERRAEISHNVWVLRSRMGLYRRFRSAIRQAEKDLLVCGSVAFIKRLLGDLLKAQRRGVVVFSMVYEPPNKPLSVATLSPLKELAKLKIAISGEHFVISDSSLAVISYRKWRVLKESNYGLVIEEPLFINYMVTDFFRNWYWARTVRDDPIELPAKLTVHKLALLEVERLIRSGVRLRGEFEGWWVETGNPGRIKGSISEVYMDLRSGLMYFETKTSDGFVRVGGPDAIVEEFAMKEVTIEREE